MNGKILSGKGLTLTVFLALGMSISSGAIAKATESKPESKQVQQPLQLTQAQGSIVGIASSNDNFSTLVQAVQAADLVNTLQQEGPFTVFAPTNQAFAMLPDDIVEFLLQPENQDILVDVLTYHVVPGNVTSGQLETGSVESLNGGLAIAVSGSSVIVNNASVIQADISATNGVIHAVNRVLLPEGFVTKLQNRIN